MDSFVRTMPLGLFVAGVGFLLVVAGIMIGAGIHGRRRAALIKGMPTSNIGMATPGYREFEGHAEAIAGQMLTAPLTDTPCVWFHAKVEKWITRTSQSGTSSWTTVREESSVAPFLIRDATGVCVVHPYGADVTATDTSVWKGATERPTDRNPTKVLRADVTPALVEISGGPNSKFRYTEERIYADDPLLVLGDYSDERFTVPEPEVEDPEADGIIEEMRGQAAGRRAPDEASDPDEDVSEESDNDTDTWESDAVIESLSERALEVTTASVSRGTSGKPFIVSTTLQAVGIAQNEMGSQAALSLAMGPLLIAAFLLWVRFS
jgi:hypothetical protein